MMPLSTAAEPSPFSNLARQASKMMEQMQKGFVFPNESWTPNVNLYENNTSYLVCVDLAGVDKEKIDLEVVDHRLRLKGNRAVPTFAEVESHPPEKIRVHLMEIDHGAFSREVEIPSDANRQSISANYRNGLLWIEIPKM